MSDKWIAFPNELAMRYAHKPYVDTDGFDTTFRRGEFNGYVTFAKVKDLEQVNFGGWCVIDSIVINSKSIEYLVYRGKDGYAWKRIGGYSAKSLDELFQKMDLDGAMFDTPTMVFEQHVQMPQACN